MIAKLIAWGESRETALADLAGACASVEVWPVKTNAGFLTRCLEHPDFIFGDVETSFIDQRLEDLKGEGPSRSALAAAAAAALMVQPVATDEAGSPRDGLTGFRLNGPPASEVRLFLDGQPVMAPLDADGAGRDVIQDEDGDLIVFDTGEAYVFSLAPPAGHLGEGGRDGQVRAPMPGKVVALGVTPGQAVSRGQALLTLEAMKMEHALSAPFDGVVERVLAAVGDQVGEGVLLIELSTKG